MPPADDPEYEWDLFISHASEDKDDIVRPLAAELRGRGLRVWYDEFELRIGQSLRGRIEHGLARSACGVVVISPSFFAKHWAREELGGLTALEAASGGRRLLPVWHRVTHADVAALAPMLADRFAASTTTAVPELAVQIIEALGASVTSVLPAVALTASLGKVEDGAVELILRNLSHTHATGVTLEPREVSGRGVPLTSVWEDTVLAGEGKSVVLRRFPPADHEAEALYDLLYTDPQQRVLKRQRLRFSLSHDVVTMREFVALGLERIGAEETVLPVAVEPWPESADTLVAAWLFSEEWLLTGSTRYVRALRALDDVPEQA